MSAILKEALTVSTKEIIRPTHTETNWQEFFTPNSDEISENKTLASKLISSGVPLSHQHCNFTNYVPHSPKEKQAKNFVQNFADKISKNEKGLIISSKNPNGKTHLAVSLVKTLLIENKLLPKFIDTKELTYQLDLEPELFLEQKLFREKLIKASILVLDDFAREIYLEEQWDLLGDIIHYRHKNLLPTIITTRLSLKEFYERVPTFIYSRLQEMCDFLHLDDNINFYCLPND